MAQYVLTEMSNFLGWITQKDLVKFTRQVVLPLPLIFLYSLSLTMILFRIAAIPICDGSQCLYNQWRGILRLGSYTRALLGSDSLKDQVLLSRRKVIIFGLLQWVPLDDCISEIPNAHVAIGFKCLNTNTFGGFILLTYYFLNFWLIRAYLHIYAGGMFRTSNMLEVIDEQLMSAFRYIRE